MNILKTFFKHIHKGKGKSIWDTKYAKSFRGSRLKFPR